MVFELKEYQSAAEIAKALDAEINRTKSMLGEYLRRLDKIRALAERSKKVQDVVFKLAGKKASQNTLGEISVGDLNVVLDANPFHELTAIEDAVRSQQDRLLVLQKAREALKWVDQIEDTEGLKYLVLENDGVPARILIKTVEESVEEVEAPTPPEAQEVLETETEKEVKSESPKPKTNLPSQQLIVDKFGGLMVRSDTVQIDSEVLQRWGSLLDVKEISEVDVETFSGKTIRCKAKVISDQKLEGRGLIRIPEKMCDTLEVKRGELVRVKPVVPEPESD